jgi:hypothetical protein
MPDPVKEEVKNKGGRPRSCGRCGKPKTQCNCGRPTVMTELVIGKLESVFAIDGTVEEACAFADISEDAFYDYQKKSPKFAERIKRLRLKPILKARNTIVQKLGNNYGNAMDYLKRKRKLEFGDNIDVTSGGKSFAFGWKHKPKNT